MTSELSDKTKSLNQSGAFLQIHTINQLQKHGWRVLSEYPVRLSPFLDLPQKNPLITSRLLGGNIPDPLSFVRSVNESMDKTSTKETSIDVVSGKTVDNYCFNLCIESKKLDPRFSDWVFFQQLKHQKGLRYFRRSYFANGEPVLFSTPKLGQQEETFLTVNKGLTEFDYPICDFALSLKNKEIERDYYKSDKTKVDESARQIMEGTYGFIVDRILQHVLKNEPVLGNGNSDYFIPIVVTNANLFTCEYDKDSINPTSGHIEKEPTYVPVDEVIYECPVPKTIQFPDPIEANTTSIENNLIRKWHVLILTPNGLTKFLGHWT